MAPRREAAALRRRSSLPSGASGCAFAIRGVSLREPVERLRESFLERVARSPSEERAGLRDADHGSLLLAGALRKVLDGHLRARDTAQDPRELRHARLHASADVESP